MGSQGIDGKAAPVVVNVPTYVPEDVKTPEPTLKDVTDQLETFFALYDTAVSTEAHLPMLPPAILEKGNAWLENMGYIDVIAARIHMAQAQTQAQLKAAQMIILFAKDIFEEGMKKVGLMKLEAQQTYEQGMLEAKKYTIQAVTALVSGLMVMGVAGNKMRQEYNARADANFKPHLGTAMKEKVFGPAVPEAPPNVPVPTPGHGLPLTPVRSPSQAGAQAGGAEGPVAVQVREVPGGAQGGAAEDVDLEVAPGQGQGKPQNLEVENKSKLGIDHTAYQRISDDFQIFKSLAESLVQCVSGFVSAANEQDINEYKRTIKLNQAEQAAADIMVKMFDTMMDIMRNFVSTSNQIIDQNYDVRALLQAMGVPFSKA